MAPTSSPTSLRSFPRPGRLAMRGQLPGLPAPALHAAGRAALRQLRVMAMNPPGNSTAPGTDLAALALHAAANSRPYWAGAPRLLVSLTVENQAGETASLSWWLEGEGEMLRWSCRGSRPEDGSCIGAAAVLAALSR